MIPRMRGTRQDTRIGTSRVATSEPRREFLRVAGRVVALGVLVAGTTRIVARRDSKPGACPGSSPCDGCSRLARCVLPPAEQQRTLARRGRERHDA